MATVDIYSNSDLLDFLDDLEKTTHRFFESGEKSVKGLPSTMVRLCANLEFNERMCKKIGSKFKYFKGVLEGNNFGFTITSDKAVSLFSSMYYSVVRNLRIHNVKGSRGFLIADDISNSTFQNVELTGIVSLEESLGGFAKTIQNVSFQDCKVKLVTRNVVAADTDGKITTDPIYFGGYAGVDLGGSKFKNCQVSGRLLSEVSVGAFCAITRNSEFEDCLIYNLEIEGKRETGFFAGRGSGEIVIKNCNIVNSNMSAGVYLGYMVGITTGVVKVKGAGVTNTYISPKVVSSFVGGIAGSADSIEVEDSKFEGGITGNFIVASISADVRKAKVLNNEFDLTITALGYSPMMIHAYPLVRREYLTSQGKDITVIERGNKVNVKVAELSGEGVVNPFKESIL